ncbi:Leucine-rich repeat-containing protein 63 [Tritrichomonas musculus]|uniref:Leucine-rich repeat-containing protein 63 n=1 Tax=Tritrichomonas musculus TaxID=1915356 RepID=A0ABR2HCF6_9EUKA
MGNSGSITVPLQNQKVVDLSNQQLNGISASPKNPIVLFLNLSYNSIQYLPKNIPSLNRLHLSSNNYMRYLPNKVNDAIISYPNLTSLDLSNNFLIFIPEAILYKPTLNFLNLYHNKFVNIDFETLNDNLKMISLGFNELTAIFKIENIVNLKFLDLEYNKIKLFSFHHPLLLSLIISSNQICSFDMSSRLDSLTILDISRNHIEKLPNLSQITPQLNNLDASHNLIREMPEFPMSISRIYMSHNRICTIPKSIEKYDKLFLINLQNNFVNKIESLPLSLQTLILTFNDITEIPNQIDTPDLISLSLTNNKLVHMPRLTCNQIFELSFYRNKLIDIDISSLCENISTLDLSNNQIEKVPSQLFTFSKLYYLNLSNNKIQTLSERIITSSLITLNISCNPIKKLPDGFPAPIECLYASFCDLTEFPESWSDACELIDLNVSGNKLTELPMIMSLLYLNASHNNFSVFPYLSPSIQKVDVSFNRITNFHDHFEYNVLEELNIANNSFTTFSPQGGIYLPSLKKLNVSCNPLNCELPFFSKLVKLISLNSDQLSTDLYDTDNNNSNVDSNADDIRNIDSFINDSSTVNSACTLITNNHKMPNFAKIVDLGYFNDFHSYYNFYYKRNNNNNALQNCSYGLCSAAASYHKSPETYSDDDFVVWSHFLEYPSLVSSQASSENVNLPTNESEFVSENGETVLMILNANDDKDATTSLSKNFISHLRGLSPSGIQMSKSVLSECVTSIIFPEFQNELSISPSYLSLAIVRPNINTNQATKNLNQSKKKKANSNEKLGPQTNSNQESSSNVFSGSEVFISRLGSCEIAFFDRNGRPCFIMNDGQNPMFSPNFNHGFAQYNDAYMTDEKYNAFIEDDFREFSLPHPSMDIKINEYSNYKKETNTSKIKSTESMYHLSLSKEMKWIVMSSPACTQLIGPGTFKQLFMNENNPWVISSKIKNILISTQYEKNVSIIVADLDIQSSFRE